MKHKRFLFFGVTIALLSLTIIGNISRVKSIAPEIPPSVVVVQVKSETNLSMSPAEGLTKVSDTLSREQANLRAYISDKFKVNDQHAAEVVEHAYQASTETGLHPNLLLAIAAVESRFDAKAENKGAKGIMQIQASAHQEQVRAIGGNRGLFNIKKNMQLGAEILQDCLSRVNNNLRKGLLRYNGSSSPSNTYADKVLNEKAKLDAAAVTYLEE